MKRIPGSMVLLALMAGSGARAQEAPSADPRIDELIARQKQLEKKLQEQEALLKALQHPAADKEPSRGRYTIVPVTPPNDPDLTAPVAGYGSRVFFLRDRHSWFVAMPKGRINVDWYNFLNRPHPPAGIEPNSAADPRAQLRDGLFLRRARLGLNATIARVIDLKLEVEFANLPTPGQYAILTDASGIINIWPWLRFEAGQFYVPFTLENQTSENATDFMDKNLVTRWTVPVSREAGAMVFGEAPYQIVRYWVGVFDGDGQNFKNLDNQPAVVGRVTFSPIGFIRKHPAWLDDLWVGGSFWWARSDNLGGSSAPSTTVTAGDLAGLSTQGAFSVFSSNYANGTDALKNAIRSHLAPNGNTYKYDFELNVPIFERYGLRSEYARQSIDLREYNDILTTRTEGLFHHLDGWGAYVEAYAWIGGNVESDKPGYYYFPHWKGYVPPQPPVWALQLAIKYEHVEFDITNPIGAGAAVGHYALDVFGLGANFWVTRHSRLMANYVMNYVGQGDPNLAAPIEKKNLFFQKLEHELLFRLQVNL